MLFVAAECSWGLHSAVMRGVPRLWRGPSALVTRRQGVGVAGSRSVRRRRQANAPGGRSAAPVQVKLTPSERELLVLRAAAEGVSLPRLLVESTLNPQWRGEGSASGGGAGLSRRQEALVALEQASELRNLLGALGRNINQIARFVNSTDGELPGELSASLAAVQRAAGEVTVRLHQVTAGRAHGSVAR